MIVRLDAGAYQTAGEDFAYLTEVGREMREGSARPSAGSACCCFACVGVPHVTTTVAVTVSTR